MRKESKKNPKNNKQKLIQVPNICPFKEDILKEAEIYKAKKEEERKKLREAAKEEREREKTQKEKTKAEGGLEGLVNERNIYRNTLVLTDLYYRLLMQK